VLHPIPVGVLLAGAVWVVFLPLIHFGFINYDDPDYVTSNLRVQAGLSWEGAKWAFTSFYSSNWHPLTWLSHMADATLFGTSAMGPHCVNLALHAANAVLLFVWLRRITGAHWPSALVAALFALHPLHVESVAWIAERKDVLSTFFGFLTLLAYERYVELGRRLNPNRQPAAESGARLPKVFVYVLGLVFFALGLMSKPMLVTLPFLLLLLDFWPLGRLPAAKPLAGGTIWSLWWEKVPFFLLSAGSCVVTVLAQRSAMQPLLLLSLQERVDNAAISYARYLGKTFWPVDLALPYPHPGRWPAAEVGLALLLIAAVSMVALGLRKRSPWLLTGWFWFLGTLVPVIGLVQVGGQAIADRYTYVPLVGIFIVAVWTGRALCASRQNWNWAGAGIGAALVLACTVLTRRQVGFWRDSETLFKHAASVTRGNYMALSNVGGALFEQGKLDEAMQYYQRSLEYNPNHVDALNSIGAILANRKSEEAVDWFQRALAVQPAHAEALFNMGNAMAAQDRHGEAVAYFKRALEIRPENYEARNNLGNSLLKLGRNGEAIDQYRLALKDRKDAATIHRNLASTLAARGEIDEAIVHFRQALNYTRTNDPATHYSLGLTLAVRARWDEAIEQYRETLRLNPTNAEAEYNLGYAFRVKGRLLDAATHLNAALRLRPEFPLAHYNLGCVLADQGDLTNALHHLKEALRGQPDYPEAAEKLHSLDAK
jgi:tetratricopeptide (TPR) repeat protein